MAILLFYTLVLSLSEHMHFNYAYILSATAVTLTISGYAKAIVSNSGFALTILGILAVLYSCLYIVLQLEDYALIMGSVGLLIILAVVMYMTRKINWYEVETEQRESTNKRKRQSLPALNRFWLVHSRARLRVSHEW